MDITIPNHEGWDVVKVRKQAYLVRKEVRKEKQEVRKEVRKLRT